MSGSNKKVPQFLTKLYQLTNNPEHADCVQWSDQGDEFWVSNLDYFSHGLLPQFFKHANYASFVRQLNMYGFHRTTVPKGHMPPGTVMVERFSHPNFLRGRMDLLNLIKRKTPNSSNNSNANNNNCNREERAAAAAVVDTNTAAAAAAAAVMESTTEQFLELNRKMEMMQIENQQLIAHCIRQDQVIDELLQIFTEVGVPLARLLTLGSRPHLSALLAEHQQALHQQQQFENSLDDQQQQQQQQQQEQEQQQQQQQQEQQQQQPECGRFQHMMGGAMKPDFSRRNDFFRFSQQQQQQQQQQQIDESEQPQALPFGLNIDTVMGNFDFEPENQEDFILG